MKKVWLNIYNSSDNFLSSTYQPLLQKYDDLLNLEVDYIGGDGQTESNITNRLGNPGQYDAFAINMVKTDNAASYTGVIESVIRRRLGIARDSPSCFIMDDRSAYSYRGEFVKI